MTPNNVPNKVTSGVKPLANQGSYQSLYDADPYAGAQYQPSPWQSFLSNVIGIRTGADAWRENMAVQSAEYRAQMALKQYDEQYELPINQVARMRAAGLNTDLLGGQGISSGEASDPGVDHSLPMQSTGEEGKLLEFANGIMSCVSLAAGLAGTIENVRGIHLDNVLKMISGEQQMSEYASKIFPYLLPPNPENAYMKTPDGIFKTSAAERFIFAAEEFAGQLPKKMQDKFLSQVTQFWNSAPGDAASYKTWRENIQAHKDYEVGVRTNFSWNGKEMAIIADELGNLASEEEKSKLRSSANEAKYNADYYGALDGTLAAESENAENKMNKENFEMTGVLNETLNNIIQRIKGLADSDKKFASTTGNVLLAALSMFKVYIASSGGPSVRRSSTSGVDARTGRNYSNHTTTLDF